MKKPILLFLVAISVISATNMLEASCYSNPAIACDTCYTSKADTLCTTCKETGKEQFC
jgi:hypothetical protein